MTIKQLIQMAPGSPIPAVAGRITAVGPYEKGEDWTVQNLMIEDPTGSIGVRIGHHDETPGSAVGQVMVFTAVKKPAGGLIGLRVQEEDYDEGGISKKCKVLEMTRAGKLMTEDEWAASFATAQPPQQPQQTNLAAQVAEAVLQPSQIQQQPQQPEQPTATERKATGKLGKIVEITYGITVNTGNYCSERAEVRIEVGDDAKASEVIAAAKQFLRKNLPEESVPAGGRQLK